MKNSTKRRPEIHSHKLTENLSWVFLRYFLNFVSKRLLNFAKMFTSAVERCKGNSVLVGLESKYCKTSIYLQTSSSIQPRRSPPQLGVTRALQLTSTYTYNAWISHVHPREVSDVGIESQRGVSRFPAVRNLRTWFHGSSQGP